MANNLKYVEGKFDLGINIICIKSYKNIEIGTRCHINGCGNLEYNYHPNARGKSGYGFGFEYFIYDIKSKKAEKFEYYLTDSEMNEYFITEEEDYIKCIRDIRINEIIK